MRLRPFGIRLLHPRPKPVLPPPTEDDASDIEPHICPECESKGFMDGRGYFYCDECGVSW